MIDFCKKNKRILIFNFISILFVHLIKFVNYYPTWDSLFGISKVNYDVTNLGRWFARIVTSFLTSPYDLQWVEAVISSIFISFTIVFLIKIFEITDKKLQYLSTLLFITFPCVTSVFVYHFWAPSYFCALFFSVLAVYICVQNKWNKYLIYIVSIILCTLSLGIYQIYYLFSALICLFYVFMKLLNKKKINELKPVICNFIIFLVGGIIVYAVVTKIILFITNIQLDSYQGISEVHLPGFISIFNGMNKAIKSFINFFMGDYSLVNNHFNFFSLYPIINTVILILDIICVIKFIVLNKQLKVNNRIILVLIILLIVPVGYGYNFISDTINYHTLMPICNFFVYFLLIILLQHCKFTKINKFIIVSLCAIVFYNYVNTNAAYHQMSISYEKTYYNNLEVAMMIDKMTNEKEKQVAIIGKFQDNGENLFSNPRLEGATTNILTIDRFRVLLFAQYYLGRSYYDCDPEIYEQIKHTKEFGEMKDFPSKDSVKIINGIIVVRLSENDY